MKDLFQCAVDHWLFSCVVMAWIYFTVDTVTARIFNSILAMVGKEPAPKGTGDEN